MVKRVRLNDEDEKKPAKRGQYFDEPDDPDITGFIPTGSTQLDEVIGGGWALSRVSNIIGDKATGKTLLAIEACANFAAKFPNGDIYYREAEHAFDFDYAESLGLPLDRIDFLPDPKEKNPEKPERPFGTVEDMERDLDTVLKDHAKNPRPGLYIVDSLDALSDESEMEAKIGDGTYGTGKAKGMSIFFRRRVRPLGRANLHLMFISQIRDNVGAALFQKKYKRSGGHALDFYGSQVIELAQMGFVHRTVTRNGKEIKRPIGVDVKAKCTKNKVCMPYRECEFPIMFGYGIDDLKGCVEWLDSVGELGAILDNPKARGAGADFVRACNKLPDRDYREEVKRIAAICHKLWPEIEKDFTPTRRKYG